MKGPEANSHEPVSWPKMRFVYGVGITLIICVSIITGVDWQAGLTLAIITSYMVIVTIRQEWGIYAIIAFAVLCIDGWAPNRSPDDVVFRLAIGHIYIMELAVYGLLAAYLVGRAFDKRSAGKDRLFVPTPLDLPLKVFAGLLPVFAVYGLALGNPAQEALGYYEWRALFMAIVFYFLITTIIGTREKALKLLWWFLVMDTFIGLYSLALYFLGSDGPLPLVLGTGPVAEGPENCMFVFAALVAISWLFFYGEKNTGKRKIIWLAAIVPFVNVLVSEKRDPQLGLLVGLVVLTWRVPFRKKVKWGMVTAAAALAVLLMASAVGLGNKSTGLEKSASRYTEVTELVQNPSSLLNLQGDLAFHILDLVDSFNSIRLRPILGYGFGGEFVRQYTALASVGGSVIEPGIVHDQYLDFGVKMGIVGVSAFLWLLVRFLRYSSTTLSQIPSSEYKAVAMGLYSAVWADLAIEFWGASWRGGTKMPIIFLLIFALVVCLLREEANFGVIN